MAEPNPIGHFAFLRRMAARQLAAAAFINLIRPASGSHAGRLTRRPGLGLRHRPHFVERRIS